MHEFASLDHQIKSAKEIRLPAVSSAAFYGQSVFTTIAVYHSAIFQWEKHWRRLTEHSFRLDIDLSNFSQKKVEESVLDLIHANDFQSGRIRLTIFEESAAGLWSFSKKRKSSLLITSAEPRILKSDLRLTISPFPINSKSPLVNLKSGNYLENILALEESRRRAFDEAVRLNEKGEAVSAVMANLFWVSDETIYTPPPVSGALQGTTRDWIKENFQVVEKSITINELNSADEIFITSAGIGIAKITSFEGKLFKIFSVSRHIQKIFKEITEKLCK